MWTWETDQNAEGTVVIVHGAGEYHRRYDWLIRRFNDIGFDVIMGDLPGQGTTPGPRGHIDSFREYTDTVAGWLDEAGKRKGPLLLFGHSMGGLIASTVIRKRSGRLPDMLLLSSPCFGLVQRPSVWKKGAAAVLNRTAPKTMFPNGLEPGSGTREEGMRTRDEGDELLVKKVSARWYRELLKAMEEAHRTTNEMPPVPVYTAQGGEDRIVDRMAVKNWFDNLDVAEKHWREWPSLYHEVMNEPEREEVFAHMAGFIKTTLSLSTGAASRSHK